MKWLISGAGGMVGRALTASLAAERAEVSRLVRQRTGRAGEISWPDAGESFEPATLNGFDVVVHLAGENIATSRWTTTKKRHIRESRLQGTRRLAEGLAGATRPPRVFLCASAVGFYGSRGEELLTEESPAGQGFLAEVARDWESAAGPALAAGIRVVYLRFGVILDRQSGALAKMLPVFRLGLGGRVGDGRQWWSWITLPDVISVIRHVVAKDNLEGPVNAVAPGAVTNAEFTRLLAQAVRRRAMLPVPAWVARLALGEMADEALLASARVVPARLAASGHVFQHPTLERALKELLQL